MLGFRCDKSRGASGTVCFSRWVRHVDRYCLPLVLTPDTSPERVHQVEPDDEAAEHAAEAGGGIVGRRVRRKAKVKTRICAVAESVSCVDATHSALAPVHRRSLHFADDPLFRFLSAAAVRCTSDRERQCLGRCDR